jgi:phage terminase large subunit GpA-like protein
LLLKGWVNKRAAEAWEDESLAKVTADGLKDRTGGYEHGTCPDGVLVVLMAVDVQDTWLEVSVWGYGRGDESWRIWHQKIEGDPAQDDVWDQVTTIRAVEWPRAGGGSMRAVHCAVDTGGHFTSEAYEYCRKYSREGVVAIKGSSDRAAPPLGRGKKVDTTFRGRTIRNGVTLYQLGVHSLKRTVYSRLKLEEPGPGFVHFDDATTEEYLQGLTCERLQPRYVKGFQILEWKKPSGARNEPLDLKAYCLAMLELVRRRYNRATMWDQLEAQLQKPKPPAGAPAERKRRPPPSRPGGFVSAW